MLLDSFAHAEDDVARRQVAEQRVEAERIRQATVAAMADSPELLTDADREAIATAMRRLDAAHAGTDPGVMRAAVEALDLASKDFAARRMNRALEQGLAGRAVGDVEAKADESRARHGAVHGHGPGQA